MKNQIIFIIQSSTNRA